MINALRITLPNVPEIFLNFGPRANSHFIATGDSPSWEPLETQLFIALLSAAPRVLDIGANIGWFTSIGGSIAGASGRFYAFEPDHDNFACLIDNIAQNRLFNVVPMRIALGDQNGGGHLYINEDNLGDHRIQQVEGRHAVPIQIAKLDTVLEGSDFVPDLIKIDVQGAETVAFEGGKKTLEKAGKRCAKLIEFWPGGMKGGIAEAEALAQRIFSWNQQVYVCHHEGDGSIRPVDIQTLTSAVHGCIHPEKPSYLDLIIAPDDSRMKKLQRYIGPSWEPWE